MSCDKIDNTLFDLKMAGMNTLARKISAGGSTDEIIAISIKYLKIA